MSNVRMYTANLDFATGPTKDMGALRRMLGLPKRLKAAVRKGTVPDLAEPQILFVQEAKTGRVSSLLAGLFTGRQGRGAARSGTGLFARGIRLHGLRLWLGGDSTETLPRWVTRGWVNLPIVRRRVVTGGDGHPFVGPQKHRRVYLMSVHIFPMRAGKAAQLRFVAKVRRRVERIERRGHAWIVGTDANMPLHEFARLIGGVPQGDPETLAGIVGFVTSKNVVVSAAGTNAAGLQSGAFDHPSKWIDVEGVR
jgi:hypothetical protein